jgi:hypothetical protein
VQLATVAKNGLRDIEYQNPRFAMRQLPRDLRQAGATCDRETLVLKERPREFASLHISSAIVQPT